MRCNVYEEVISSERRRKEKIILPTTKGPVECETHKRLIVLRPEKNNNNNKNGRQRLDGPGTNGPDVHIHRYIEYTASI